MARQLDRNSTARRPGAWCQPRQASSTGSAGTLDRSSTQSWLDRQGLDSASTACLDSASTAPRRSLDSSTARQPGLKAARVRLGRRGRSATAADIGAMCAELTRTHVNTLIESLIRPSAPNTIGNSTLALQALEPATLVTRWVSHSCMTQGFEPIVI